MDVVTQTEFAKMLGISKEAVRQLRVGERPGPRFPDHQQIGPRMLVWQRADALAYIEARKKYLGDRNKMLDTSQA